MFLDETPFAQFKLHVCLSPFVLMTQTPMLLELLFQLEQLKVTGLLFGLFNKQAGKPQLKLCFLAMDQGGIDR